MEFPGIHENTVRGRKTMNNPKTTGILSAEIYAKKAWSRERE
jgi:hypothetical protein